MAENYDTPGERALAERLYFEKYGYPVDPYEIDGAQSSSGGPQFSWYVQNALQWQYYLSLPGYIQRQAQATYGALTQASTGEVRDLKSDVQTGAVAVVDQLATAANTAVETAKTAAGYVGTAVSDTFKTFAIAGGIALVIAAVVLKGK